VSAASGSEISSSARPFSVSSAVCVNGAAVYFSKWRGKSVQSPPLPSLSEAFFSFLGSFVGVGSLAALTFNLLASSPHPTFLLIIGSMGATAVLVYAVPAAPLSQPRNVIGGHVLSAIIGVGIRIVIGDLACGGACLWLASALSVSCAIAAMQATGTVHPPGGATALIAVSGGTGVLALGWWFVLFPAAVGSVLMVVVGVLVNNLAPGRVYPQRWL
jgi:CBS-domain-containing membrane protein